MYCYKNKKIFLVAKKIFTVFVICMEIKNYSGINFQAGFNSNIAKLEKEINPIRVLYKFKNSDYCDFGCFYNTDFKNNKSCALASNLCADIFTNLRKIFDYRNNKSMQSLVLPQDIYVYSRKSSDLYKDKDMFVNIIDFRPEKDKPVFYSGTIFLPEEINSLEKMNSDIELMHSNKLLSSNHFLHNFVHEWVHSIFSKLIKSRTFLGSYSYDNTMRTFELQKLTEKEKQLVADNISVYPTKCKEGQYPEVLAESWTKFICESLSDDCTTFKQNPVDVLKSMPKEFQELLKKISDVKFLHLFE